MNDAASAAASNYTPATLDPSYKRTEADNQLVAALQSEDGRKELKALFVSLDRNDDEKVDQIEWGRGLAKNQARRNPSGAIPRNYSHRTSIPSRRC